MAWSIQKVFSCLRYFAEAYSSFDVQTTTLCVKQEVTSTEVTDYAAIKCNNEFVSRDN